MAVIKCKMCGGDLNLIEGQSVAECEYCGSRQTVPAADNEKKLTLFSRANRLRIACEFDKAAGVYEAIVADFPTEAEAYWGLVLCKYGIEYVDDPATGKKIPTCHRSSFDAVMDDTNFGQVLENADTVSRKVYREEAKTIDEIRRGIIEVSANELPYDVFICYKETAEDGQRTVDSVMAQDIYDALTEKGYRVFFSRITLEDKLGQEYEPYIFAALNSAKVMLAIGTDYEHFNAVWVKNEWSRFLKLMEKDRSKHLIPCYKDIDAYDMPKEFNKLQAQDLGKVGAVQDLLRGISKLVEVDTAASQQKVDAVAVIIDPLLKRAADAITMRDWERAARCYDSVLDYDDKNEAAYIGRILIGRRVSSLTDLENAGKSIASDPNYQYLIEHGTKATADKMRMLEDTILKNIKEKKEQEKRLKKQKAAKNRKIALAVAAVVVLLAAGYWLAVNVLIPGSTYSKANTMAKNGQYDEAIATFESLGDFRDSNARIYETYMLKAEAFAADENYTAAIAVLESPELMEMGYGLNQEKKTEYSYLYAKQAYDNGDYLSAIERFEVVSGYENTDEYVKESRYILAEQSYDNGDFDMAIDQFSALGDYKEGAQRASDIAYEVAESDYQSEKYEEAINRFRELGDYREGALRASQIAYEVAAACYENGELDRAILYFTMAQEYEDASVRVVEINYEAGKQCMENQEYLNAVGYFEKIPDYSDVKDLLLKAKYKYCEETQDAPSEKTKTFTRELNNMGYSGAAKLYSKVFAWKVNLRAEASLRMGTQTGVSYYAELSGGDVGASTTLKFVAKLNGETVTYCDDEQYSAGDEATCQISSAMVDVIKMKHTVYVYDSNGNQIGYFSGLPKDFDN